MKKTFKRTMAALLATATMAVGVGGISASATSWEASHVNVSGAPSSESTTDYITVANRSAGAKAVCNYNSHSNTTADTGYTYINCTNYTMTQVKIENTASKTCKPSVGSPTTDISVSYKVSASTPTSNDVFWTRGNITKIS